MAKECRKAAGGFREATWHIHNSGEYVQKVCERMKSNGHGTLYDECHLKINVVKMHTIETVFGNQSKKFHN